MGIIYSGTGKMSEKRRWDFEHRHNREDYGQRWEIAAFLADGPRSLEEIAEHYKSYIRFIGFFGVSSRLDKEEARQALRENVQRCLDQMLMDGWIKRAGHLFEITESGAREAEKMLVDMRRTREFLKKAATAGFVSSISLAVHLVLAVLKLAGGFISGSIGLLNDAFDTLLDGLSSLLLVFGIRYHREKLVNSVLVLLMMVTGGFTLFEAVRRFFVPASPEMGFWSLLATILSLAACGLLGLYQRFIGLKTGNMALVTQSIDSRNHVIVAGGVMIGLIFSSFDIFLVDTFVGLGVALLILKSAVELFIDLARTWKGEEVDLENYQMGFVKRYENMRVNQLSDWMLYKIDRQGFNHLEDLRRAADESMNFADNPALRELGLDKVNEASLIISKALDRLKSEDWVGIESDDISLTEPGRRHLQESLRLPDRQRWVRRQEKMKFR